MLALLPEFSGPHHLALFPILGPVMGLRPRTLPTPPPGISVIAALLPSVPYSSLTHHTLHPTRDPFPPCSSVPLLPPPGTSHFHSWLPLGHTSPHLSSSSTPDPYPTKYSIYSTWVCKTNIHRITKPYTRSTHRQPCPILLSYKHSAAPERASSTSGHVNTAFTCLWPARTHTSFSPVWLRTHAPRPPHSLWDCCRPGWCLPGSCG